MSANQREEKIYGAIDTEDYFTFKGFCKKINSKEQHKVNVYIDGVLDSTLEANKHIKSIESTYDMYDTNGFCFEYEIDEKLIHEKHKIEFKTEDDEQLLNSPVISLNSSFPEYNKILFMKSLYKEIDKNITSKSFKKDSLGFFATKENLKDINFINFIKETYNKFPQLSIKAFYFDNNADKEIKKIFKNELSRLTCILPLSIIDVTSNVSIWYSNSTVNNRNLHVNIFEILFYRCENIFYTSYNFNNFKKTIDQFNKENQKHHYLMDYEYFSFTKEEIINAENKLSKLVSNKWNFSEKKYNLVKDYIIESIRTSLENKLFSRDVTRLSQLLKIRSDNG